MHWTNLFRVRKKKHCKTYFMLCVSEIFFFFFFVYRHCLRYVNAIFDSCLFFLTQFFWLIKLVSFICFVCLLLSLKIRLNDWLSICYSFFFSSGYYSVIFFGDFHSNVYHWLSSHKISECDLKVWRKISTKWKLFYSNKKKHSPRILKIIKFFFVADVIPMKCCCCFD